MIGGMGAYENSRREGTYGRDSRVDCGAGVGGLSDRFSGLSVGDSSRDHLFQVMKAVEDAESIISQQLGENTQLRDENNLLRDELLRQTRELEKYKLTGTSVRPSADVLRAENVMGPYGPSNFPANFPAASEADIIRWGENGSAINPQRTLVIHQNGILPTGSPSLRSSTGGNQNFENSKLNGSVKVSTGVQAGIDSAGPSQFSSPSSRSLSPSMHRKDGEYDPRFNSSKDGLMPVSEINSNTRWKRDLAIKVREHEEEISQLRKHLAEYSIKEAQVRNEKYVLEKRIAYMRMAFDQQQQDLVDAASKALSYRQEIIEENIRLTYQLQAAQQERSTFFSLLPLLSEYGLQPPVPEAQSIVSNLKVLFKHLQEKLIITEDALKDSQYQLNPWHTEALNNTSFPPKSPPHPLGASLATPNENSLEIVPQQLYTRGQSPVSSPSNAQTRVDWELSANQNRYTASGVVPAKKLDHNALESSPPSINRNSMAPETSARANQGDAHVVRFNLASKNQNLSFTDLFRGNEVHDAEATGLQHAKEAAVHWGAGSSEHVPSTLDDPNSYLHLPPVLEEPGSSFSEAADDDPLPAIDGLQISGDAFPGRELSACGYSINGTTNCNFEWVRYLEDGSVNYIEEAKRPNYLVTADDVDSLLAIEVHPLDERKRKGDLVKVFANDQMKITCDQEMQEQIERTLSVGHVSFEVMVRASDTWKPAILAIKREGYSIKFNGTSGVFTEKFLPTTAIIIPYGFPLDFVIHGANGDEYLLQTTNMSWSRDAIVRIMRLFKNRVMEKRKGKKRGLFFK